MIRKFSVTNYKNFKGTLELDFGRVGGYKFNTECIKNGIITKCLLYGRNATGKTNLGSAIGDIRDIFTQSYYRNTGDRILNADSDMQTAIFDYEFVFDGDIVSYTYQRNIKCELVKEKLVINNKLIFDMNFETASFEKIDLSQIDADTIQVDKYINMVSHSADDMDDAEYRQVPFLRYILNNAALMPDSVLSKMEDFVKRIRLSAASIFFLENGMLSRSFSNYLVSDNNLKHFETFLNEMGVKCKLEMVKSVDGRYELFFKHKTLVPFYNNASSGTLTLVNFYKKALAVERKPSLFYMDEFDAFYNYEMSEKIVKYLKHNFPDSQIVLTTHNTNLMTNQLMRPDCLFILSGAGKVTALCDATERELRKGHNLEKLYIGGEFEQYE